MENINMCALSGNVTRDPVLRSTPSGMSVLSFGMAVNERRKGQDGEWADKPNFFDVCVFGRRADALGKFLSKGTRVFVQGHLSFSSWEKDGVRRSKVEVVADNVEFVRKTTHEEPARRDDGYDDGYTSADIPF